ncbi:hypothetical protein EYF80_022332 [Liparis tanakae]|uniref:Uncharacterized protein n=1 Tax=Liparis tanakae TaxID=230148 RepID=A0A4Z2HNN3_9TELE|nr:hypothetical protein EYF80_022332 [Liparis tanakae]
MMSPPTHAGGLIQDPDPESGPREREREREDTEGEGCSGATMPESREAERQDCGARPRTLGVMGVMGSCSPPKKAKCTNLVHFRRLDL